MAGPEAEGVAALLLLVLPALAALCVVLTAPVARAIGRRQREEEQVLRAPLLVAGIAALIETGLAAALFRRAAGGEVPLPIGPLYFELSPYSLSSVLTLSTVVLVLLVVTELAQNRAGVVGADQLAGVLFAWGALCCLALAGSLSTALLGVWLNGAAASGLLLLEAFRHGRWGKLWLVGWAVLIPLGLFVLLLPFRGLELGEDLLDARVLLRSRGVLAAEGLLLRLWLAGGLTVLAGLVAFASMPRVPAPLSPAPIVLTAGVLAGTLPAVFRVSLSVLPGSVLVDGHLASNLRIVWIIAGIVSLLASLLTAPPLRRLCMHCVCVVAGVGWLMARFDPLRATWPVAGSLGATLSLPLCFAAVQAVEVARVLPAAAGRWLPWSAILLFPATAALWSHSEPFLEPSRLVAPGQVWARMGDLLFIALLVVGGVAAVAMPLVRHRQEALRRGQFSGSGGTLPAQQLGELVVLVPWIVLVALLVMHWGPAIRELPRLLP
jgi:hypothetical protein